MRGPIFPYGAEGLIGERRPPSVADAGSSYTTYYADGSVQMQTDEVGVKTYYTYAGQGRVATVTKDHQGAQAVRFDYAYDPAFPEKVISILPRNPVTGANDPNWQGWQYEYYQAGSPAPGALHRVYRLQSDGVTQELMATYVYDAKGRVTSVTDRGGAATDYVYDAAGNLESVTAPSNNDAATRPVTTYGYDSLTRLTAATERNGSSTNASWAYAYDKAGNRLSQTRSGNTGATAGTFTTSYNAANQITATTWGNLVGTVTNSNNRITWSNGTIWNRAS